MGECAICGKQIDLVSGYECNHCGESHCSDHRLPEKHLCGVETISMTGTGEGEFEDEGSGWDLVTVLGLPLVAVYFVLRVAWMTVAGAGRAFVSSPLPILGLLIVVGGAGAVVGGYVPAGSADGGADAAEDDALSIEEAERLIHQEVNERRAERGIAELHYHEGLADDARGHSEDMDQRDFFAHENPDGEGPQERTTTRCMVSENLNGVYWNTRYEAPDGEVITIDTEEELAEQIVDEWMRSPDHRENLLDERFASEGIGVAIDQESGEVYVTQMFCL